MTAQSFSEEPETAASRPASGMQQDAVLNDFLTVSFRSYLAKILTFVEPLREGTGSSGLSGAQPSSDLTPAAIRSVLKNGLDGLARRLKKLDRDPSAASFEQARYLMATAADGLLTDFDWSGANAWINQPLRNDFPPPDGVSADVARQADALASADDPNRALVEILLMTLSLPLPEGAADKDSDELDEIREKLSERLPTSSADGPLFPDAYRRRQRTGPTVFLPDVRTWQAIALALLLFFALISYPIWRGASEPARNTVDQILAVPAESAP